MDEFRLKNLIGTCRDFARQTLGWLFTCPDAWDERLHANMFFDHAHRQVFEAMERIRDRDELRSVAMVLAELRHHAEPNARDWTIVVDDLVEGAAFPGHERFAISKIVDIARRWTAIGKHDQIGELLADPTIDIDDIERLTGVSGIVPRELTAATSS